MEKKCKNEIAGKERKREKCAGQASAMLFYTWNILDCPRGVKLELTDFESFVKWMRLYTCV